MPDWRVPLADVEIGEAGDRAVTETYRSRLAQHGPPHRVELEERFAEYTGISMRWPSPTARRHSI